MMKKNLPIFLCILLFSSPVFSSSAEEGWGSAIVQLAMLFGFPAIFICIRMGFLIGKNKENISTFKCILFRIISGVISGITLGLICFGIAILLNTLDVNDTGLIGIVISILIFLYLYVSLDNLMYKFFIKHY